MKILTYLLSSVILLAGCQTKKYDLIIHNTAINSNGINGGLYCDVVNEKQQANLVVR